MEINNNELVLILKNAGTSCNIGCEYCAEHRKKMIDKSKLEMVTLADIKKLIEITRSIKNLTVLFHGGEPLLLSPSYYEEIISMWRANRTDVYFGIQTNATLINEDWLNFIEKYHDVLGLSISLDGDAIANSYRRDKNGIETFSRVKHALDLLRERNIEVGVISTITQAALGRERELFDLVALYPNIRFVKLNPCYDMWSDGVVPSWGILPDEYATFVIHFFDIMFNEKYFRKLNVEPSLSIMKGILGIENSFCNFCNRKCNHFMSIYPNGKTIACDNFDLADGMYKNWHDVNDIHELMNNPPQPLFSQLDSLLEQCEKCSWHSICHGGCLAVRRRYHMYGKKDEQLLYCHEMQRMIQHIMDRIESVKSK